MPTVEERRLLRELTGFGLADCRSALLAADDFGGDVIVALAAVEADGLAIHVKGDRADWIRSRAPGIADRWRAESPALDEFFPKPAGRPGPAPSP
ncbi:hypothetical protein [Methylorubrum extorquens]|uniref:Uncharacterized protein n=2 Tax=Methylorubrum extorquens TaxID=408 RepID=C5B6B3_METEA|nr:hypothetical protein [Methylorubrum extorquens]ACS43995.1 Hypothetical protein MexAM1_META2p1254 [Methylorubrum extorquens AM1]EHP95058.1 hypothetical protein MetexDRAFT_0050 [Methylorubrum extorquens DSM 13060]MCP1546137.1 hypothetical protein [Methylorubrum extorquens]MCP1590804.1 hypothetical protein [Methylorubrum extorquens]